jgi:phytoene/squalene synthetase
LIATEIRHADYDRYLSALFAPEPARSHLLAFYAFNHEVAKIAEMVREPLAGLIRLQWWRETVEELFHGKARHHEVVLALAEVLRAHDLPQMLFDELIDAREHDLEPQPFVDMAALETYADATSGNVMQLAARILGGGDAFDTHAREAGIAYALAGLLRALPYTAARRHFTLPRDMLAEAGLTTEDVFAGRNSAALKSVMEKIAKAAHAHLAAARALPKPGAALPALLPAALCPLYLRVLTRAGFDPFRNATDIPRFRRQLAMLGASLRGRV